MVLGGVGVSPPEAARWRADGDLLLVRVWNDIHVGHAEVLSQFVVGDEPLDEPNVVAHAKRAGELHEAAEGIHLCYHNHAFEFDKIDGEKTDMDVLIDLLDPRYCGLAVDVAWVWRGRASVPEFLRTHREHITYLHLKDTDETHWKELGQGKLDWPAVMKEIADLPHCGFAAVEQDQTYDTDPLESLAISRAFLKDKFGY
jgi:sugar phosphate isomerase/epimerase